MRRRIIEIDDLDVERIISPQGYVTEECKRNIKEALRNSTIIDECKKQPYRIGLETALNEVIERRTSERELAQRCNEIDKHVYAEVLLNDIADHITKKIAKECEKENRKALKKIKMQKVSEE